ncbi:MAG: Beta-barrel assembly-enhancing protease [Anaerolineales bacterium]|nr:Beta-barrel assembly-enhancing protease [Anaerolineales bacterium]
MTKRKKRKKQARGGAGIPPHALQIIQRKFGGRRPDRAKVFSILLQEACRSLEKSQYDVALELVDQAEKLARSDQEAQRCDSLSAEIFYERGSDPEYTDQASLDDLEFAVLLAPQKTRYRLQFARALIRDGQLDSAIHQYETASKDSAETPARFLWAVTALKADQSLPSVELTPAEQNTLDAVQNLLTGHAKSNQLAEPVLDSSQPLWEALLEMQADVEAAPIESMESALSAWNGTQAPGAARYYLGVSALRAGDLDTAWQALADAQEVGYTPPWLNDNFSYLSRAQAIQRAATEDWQGVIDVGEPALQEIDDRILAETVSLAYFHLGYEAARTDDWETAADRWRQAEGYDSNRYLAQNLALAREQREDWKGAAEAWRDVIRRRPRKDDHPDYLDDNQVAGVWHHTAECYQRANIPSEAITCHQNALKYTPDDLEIRHELSIALIANSQFEAAENELNRILERDADDVKALVRLGQLYRNDEWRSWRYGDRAVQALDRVLELDPKHEEAREALADYFIEQGTRHMDWGRYSLAAEQFRQGLEHLPDYAWLHARLGVAERRQGNEEQAREHFWTAYELEPDRASVAGYVLHEFLHMDETEAERLLPRIQSSLTHVLPRFWVDQGERALGCELGTVWVEAFFEEALALAGEPWVSETRAEILVDIIMTLHGADEGRTELERKYRERIEREAPNSGAKELIDSLVAVLERGNFDKADRLLGKARHKARKAGESGLLAKIEAFKELIFAGPLGLFGPSGPGSILERLFR